MKKIVVFMIFIYLVLIPVIAENIDISNGQSKIISFQAEINKTGTPVLYFSDPDNYTLQANALYFSIVGGQVETSTAEIGVVWRLFPEAGKSNIKLTLEASEQPAYSVTPDSEGYMLAASGSSEIAGLNYSITNPDGFTGDSIVSGVTITNTEDITKPIKASQRQVTIADKQNVTSNGIEGETTLALKLDPPEYNNGEEYFMASEYVGYLILHVDSY